MAAQVPAALKAADISRFAFRAAQLEKAKPIVAYWCDYWIVNQILSKGLHNADQECLTYTTNLMDKLEQFKSQHADEPAVTDDIAGKAYVEQFGLEIFSRADNAVRANKASKQTADNFQAAATFLELLQIWGPIDAEITPKIKFAKYHALRIGKAIKNGEDPNLSNPVPEAEPESSLPALDPDDADVKTLEGGLNRSRHASVVEVPDEADRIQKSLAATSAMNQSLHPSRDTSQPPATNKARQPSVVEAPDDADKIQRNLARQSVLDESLHPSRAPSNPRSPAGEVSPLAPQDAASFYTSQNGPADVSPIGSASERKPSIGGNYFPRVPSPSTKATDPIISLPSAPTTTADPTTFSPLDLPTAPSEPSLPPAPTVFGHHPPPPASSTHHGHFLTQQPTDSSPVIPSNFAPSSDPVQPVPHAPPQLRQQQQPQPPMHPHGPTPIIPPHNIHPSAPPQQYPRQQAQPPAPPPTAIPNTVVDEEAMMKAQKHARWAISALNFEDVPTAIRELRGALAQLGAM